MKEDKKNSVLLMQTDFGHGGGSAMFGVCKTVCRDLEVHDISHIIPKFDVKAAAQSLINEIPNWPEGTVFVSVVDPGVGTERKACVALLENGAYVVTPDNGIFGFIEKKWKVVEIRQIDETINRLKGTERTSIFHGRDLFAYCGARLAANVITFEQVGPSYSTEQIVRSN